MEAKMRKEQEESQKVKEENERMRQEMRLLEEKLDSSKKRGEEFGERLRVLEMEKKKMITKIEDAKEESGGIERKLIETGLLREQAQRDIERLNGDIEKLKLEK